MVPTGSPLVDRRFFWLPCCLFCMQSAIGNKLITEFDRKKDVPLEE